MEKSMIKNILTIILAIVLFVIAFRIVRWVAVMLLPIAVVVCAAYIVYKLINKSR